MAEDPKKAKLSHADGDEVMEEKDGYDGSTAASQSTTLLNVTGGVTDRDILRLLHPIVYNLEPYQDADSLLEQVQFLRLSPSFAFGGKEYMLEQLESVFINARCREAGKVPSDGGVEDEFRIAAVEIRHSILYGKLKAINGDPRIMVYGEGVADVQDPGRVAQVIIREEDRMFWERCVDITEDGRPVCGIGNPGIGKTTTTIYLLQHLICNKKKSVVYTIRTSQETGPTPDIFYELVPVMDNEESVIDVSIKVYKMMHSDIKRIPLLNSRSGVYVVDPGEFNGSCDISNELRGNQFIMNASNDEKHWGGKNFEKHRLGVSKDRWRRLSPTPEKKAGILIHGSLWTAQQLLVSKVYLELGHLADDELLRRYRIVGGSIRDILEFNEAMFVGKVDRALELDALTFHGLMTGAYQFPYTPSAPSSILVGLRPQNEDLDIATTVLKSDYISEKLAKRHLKISWYAVLNQENAGNRGNMFESYLREIFSSAATCFSSQEVRESVRTKPPRPAPANRMRNYQPVDNGMTIGCEQKRTIVRVSHMNERVITDHQHKFVFYSKDEFEPLIDMIWKIDGGYVAIQATIARDHGAATDKIRTLKNELVLKDKERLRIFFVLPNPRYSEFVTNPVNPLYDPVKKCPYQDLMNVEIFHVGVSGEAG